MPTISRIVSVKATGQSFDTPNGTFYPYEVILDDGTQGEANSKTAAPKYTVGDSVCYEVTKTIRGVKKLKLTNPEQSFKPALPRTSEAPSPVTHTQVTNAKFNSDGMERGMCLKMAGDMVMHNYKVTNTVVDTTVVAQELYDLAEQILAASAKLKTL